MKLMVPRSIAAIADSVGKPAIKKRLIGGSPFGQAEIAFALQGLDRAQQHGLGARFAAHIEKGVERAKCRLANPSVGNQIGIIAAIIYLRKQTPWTTESRTGRR